MAKILKNKKVRAESRARYFIREQASKRGWDVRHIDMGGDFLEENEIERTFPDIGLGGEKPDFLICLSGNPTIAVEAKSDIKKIDVAIEEACEYVEKINDAGRYQLHLAVGAAGEEDTGFAVVTKYLTKKGWQTLDSHGASITAFPSRREIELAIHTDDATTEITLPEQSDFIDAAIELSVILRHAKVEAPLRPKVIGAVVAAMYQGEIEVENTRSLKSVNNLMAKAIKSASDITNKKKQNLVDALKLSGADFNRLAPFIGRVVTILKRLNIRVVLQTDTDFLGMFYEAFLRYGYDNKALGIVFTPRHITRYCIDLAGVTSVDKVIDIACGTGGFLVAAFDKMVSLSKSVSQRTSIKSSLTGFDTNPTIWALATLNMFFRGDGKSHIENANCFDKTVKDEVSGKYTRAFLNPPFSQEGEPERMFIDASMNALEPEGVLAAVVYAGLFADDEHKPWRRDFLLKHTLMGVISLPEDLFYPTAAPVSILIAQAHIPHQNEDTFMARVWNDGYEKLKGRRVPAPGEQLTDVLKSFWLLRNKKKFESNLCTTVSGDQIKDGEEWSPQQWLPQPPITKIEFSTVQKDVLQSLFKSVVYYPKLSENVLDDMGDKYSNLPALPVGKKAPLSFFFNIANGKSSGEKNYPEGDTPYVSSGDSTNSIVGTVSAPVTEDFDAGGITITAFGQAALQPWPFVARGNGGSSVRVLTPKFNMTIRELIWFVAQINIQKWRYLYARMAIKGRLEGRNFQVISSERRLKKQLDLRTALVQFKKDLETYTDIL